MTAVAILLLAMSTAPAAPSGVGADARPAGAAAVDTLSLRLTDDLGRELALAAPPRRIVSLLPAATEILFALGAGDRVVGRTRFDRHPPEATRVPSVGDGIRPSVELVVARRPDLVILYAGSANAGVAREMERAGLAVLAVRHDGLEDLERNIARLGRLTGCEAEAKGLARRISSGLAHVATAVERFPTRSVYYDVWADPPVTVGAGSFLDSLLAVAGGRNVFGDLPVPSPQVSLEAIAARRPDVVVWAVDPDGRDGRTDPRARTGWAAVEAVRRGAVRAVDADLVHRLGPRVPEAAEALAHAIHPELEGRRILVAGAVHPAGAPAATRAATAEAGVASLRPGDVRCSAR